MIMSTRTSTLVIAAAWTAAAFTLNAQAADPDSTTQQSQVVAQQSRIVAQQGQVVAQQSQAAPPQADAAAETSRASKPARTLDRNWWEEERALDDGYVWPLPSASRMR
jgi:hypothetical protein